MNTSRTRSSFVGPASLGFVLLTLTFVGPATTAGAGPLKEGDSFPELKHFKLEGELPDLAGKVVLVDFFASWCGPCQDSFPVMEELHEQFGAKGLVILAINLDQKEADMKEFLARHPVTFPVVRDAANALVKEVKISTMPSSFLLDRTGKVRFVHRGFKGGKTREEYRRQISELLE
jgi:thiol-disulfide isomerase/thioredoxin